MIFEIHRKWQRGDGIRLLGSHALSSRTVLATVCFALTACTAQREPVAPPSLADVQGSSKDSLLQPGIYEGYEVRRQCMAVRDPLVAVIGTGSRLVDLSEVAIAETYMGAAMAAAAASSAHAVGIFGPCVPETSLSVHIMLNDWKELDSAARRVAGWLVREDLDLDVVLRISAMPTLACNPPCAQVGAKGASVGTSSPSLAIARIRGDNLEQATRQGLAAEDLGVD